MSFFDCPMTPPMLLYSAAGRHSGQVQADCGYPGGEQSCGGRDWRRVQEHGRRHRTVKEAHHQVRQEGVHRQGPLRLRTRIFLRCGSVYSEEKSLSYLWTFGVDYLPVKFTGESVAFLNGMF